MQKAPYLSVIIPCFNEEDMLPKTFERVMDALEGDWHKGAEVIFVNDGSSDQSLDLLRAFARENENVKVLNFSRNFGHQAAVTAGISYCSGDVAIIIDADLQDPPELFKEMVAIYREKGANVVYGVRRQRRGETWFKKLTAKWFYRLLNSLSDVNLNVDTGDFRLIDRKVINAFKGMGERNKYIRGLISWMGFKQEPIYYDRDARMAGETKYPLGKMLKLASIAMFYFSKKPLKMAITLGVITLSIGLLLTIYVLVAQFSANSTTTPGWASTLISIIFFGGVQLITIGVTGEYIGNILDEVKGRPEFIVEEEINIKKAD
ncbi:MAG TPA: glycosyltransferase [Bacteroidetes bacterium]|nr:glycosyltransferase [Bacteroidota bacterium]